VTDDHHVMSTPTHELFNLERGQGVPLSLLIHRSRTLALLASNFIAYSAGFEFQLSVIRRGPAPAVRTNFQGIFDLMIAVETESGRQLRIREDDIGHGENDLWLSFGYVVVEPPPMGRIALIANWPARRMVDARAEFDSEILIGASRKAEKLWP
jgi:hypothetical protein